MISARPHPNRRTSCELFQVWSLGDGLRHPLLQGGVQFAQLVLPGLEFGYVGLDPDPFADFTARIEGRDGPDREQHQP